MQPHERWADLTRQFVTYNQEIFRRNVTDFGHFQVWVFFGLDSASRELFLDAIPEFVKAEVSGFEPVDLDTVSDELRIQPNMRCYRYEGRDGEFHLVVLSEVDRIHSPELRQWIYNLFTGTRTARTVVVASSPTGWLSSAAEIARLYSVPLHGFRLIGLPADQMLLPGDIPEDRAKEEADWIHNLTGGHPFLLKSLAPILGISGDLRGDPTSLRKFTERAPAVCTYLKNWEDELERVSMAEMSAELSTITPPQFMPVTIPPSILWMLVCARLSLADDIAPYLAAPRPLSELCKVVSEAVNERFPGRLYPKEQFDNAIEMLQWSGVICVDSDSFWIRSGLLRANTANTIRKRLYKIRMEHNYFPLGNEEGGEIRFVYNKGLNLLALGRHVLPNRDPIHAASDFRMLFSHHSVDRIACCHYLCRYLPSPRADPQTMQTEIRDKLTMLDRIHRESYVQETDPRVYCVRDLLINVEKSINKKNRGNIVVDVRHDSLAGRLISVDTGVSALDAVVDALIMNIDRLAIESEKHIHLSVYAKENRNNIDLVFDNDGPSVDDDMVESLFEYGFFIKQSERGHGQIIAKTCLDSHPKDLLNVTYVMRTSQGRIRARTLAVGATMGVTIEDDIDLSLPEGTNVQSIPRRFCYRFGRINPKLLV